LTGVTDPDGASTFGYVSGGTAAQNNALASYTYSNGVTQTYTYDTTGRLINQ